MSLDNYSSGAKCCPSYTPYTDSNGHGQLLNGARTDLLLDLLSKILFMARSRDKTNLEGFLALLHRQNG